MNYNRTNPFSAHIQERHLLTKPGSTKAVYHLAISLKDSHLSYEPGDSLAIFPENDPEEIARILSCFSFDKNESVLDPRSNLRMPFHTYLTTKANLQRPSPAILRAWQIDADDSPLSDLFSSHPNIDCSPDEATKLFLPLLPRFYSIASACLVHPEEAHLTVATVSYLKNGKTYHGVASHFLCSRANFKTPISVYIQPSRHFRLPEDPNASIIMIGVGTGIAPFRAFLEHRVAAGHLGKNWLFFGERNRNTDFYYEDFFLQLEKTHRLKLTTAFSRDASEKCYVHHEMWQARKDLWNQLELGAYLYVCGDAAQMAKDVEACLIRIATIEGGLPEEAARHKIASLRTEKRYLLDVY